MEIIDIKIRRFKEHVKGILIGNGLYWSFIRLNVVDYVLDGYQFINKRYIDDFREIEKDTLLYKILSKKNSSNNILHKINLNVLDEVLLLYSYLKNNNFLVAVCLHREDVFYVGRIKEINSKSFILDSYDTKLKKCGTMNIEFNKVRFVQIHSDYLDSLCLFLDETNNNKM